VLVQGTACTLRSNLIFVKILDLGKHGIDTGKELNSKKAEKRELFSPGHIQKFSMCLKTA
jgi:hypothetical protein